MMLESFSNIPLSQMGREIDDPVIVDLMNQALRNPNLLSLAAGFTDNSALPREYVGKVVSELTADGFDQEILQYGSNQGRPRLRELTGEIMDKHPDESGDRFVSDRVFITNGSQQALYIAVQTICDRGDIILVEEPSYFVCLEMLKGLGVRPVGIPCEPDGAIQLDEFARLLRAFDGSGDRERVKGIYLVSYFSNPSSRSMTRLEKDGVAEVLSDCDYRIPVIEDGAYRELYFKGPPDCPSVVNLPSFGDFPKLYLGTYTKPFATGLKVGFGYCSDEYWLKKILSIKGHQDFGSSNFAQSVIERVIELGYYEDHLDQVRPHYSKKAEIVSGVLSRTGLKQAGWKWIEPKGGLLFWLRGPTGLDTRIGSEFCNRCIEQGVLYVPGDLCFASGKPYNCVRLSFGAIAGDKLEEAVERFSKEAAFCTS